MPDKPRENFAEISCLVQVDGESSASSAWKIAQKPAHCSYNAGSFPRYDQARALRISQSRLEALRIKSQGSILGHSPYHLR